MCCHHHDGRGGHVTVRTWNMVLQIQVKNIWWRAFIIVPAHGSGQIMSLSIGGNCRVLGSMQIWFCNRLSPRMLMKRLHKVQVHFRWRIWLCYDFGGGGSLAFCRFRKPRFILILRSRLRQIQFCNFGYLLNGLLSTLRCCCGHWRLLRVAVDLVWHSRGSDMVLPCKHCYQIPVGFNSPSLLRHGSTKR